MRKTVVVLVVLAAIILAAPFVVPTSAMLPTVAALAAEKLGQPIEIAELELHLVPTPRLVAKGIRIGKAAEASIGELEIVPALWSLVSGPTTLRLVRAKKVELREGAFAIIEGMPPGGGGGAEVRRVELEQVRLAMTKPEIPEFNATLELGPGTQVAEARLTARDGSLRARLEPQSKDVLALAIDARHWQPPATPLRFDALNAKGRLVGMSALELSQVEGKLYGGSLSGDARAEWGAKWQVAGKLAIEGIDLRALQKAFGTAPRLTGRLSSQASFSTQARTAAGLLPALSVDGPFEVLGGAYQGIDLASVGDLTGSKGQGGTTRFEQFKGVLSLRGRQVSIRELCVRSPQLVAAGSVEVAADDRLSGKLDVALAKAQRLTRVPVVLGGTTGDPTVRPAKAYVIGAVVGTVLLPGIGTGLGASAGGALSGKASGCN